MSNIVFGSNLFRLLTAHNSFTKIPHDDSVFIFLNTHKKLNLSDGHLGGACEKITLKNKKR